MAQSQTSISNRGLQILGASRVTDVLTEESKNARAMRENWEAARDLLLRSNLWNFAMTRAELSALVETPAFGYTTLYQLPSDCLRAVQVGDWWVGDSADLQGGDPCYQIEGGKIATDEAAPLRFRYIKRITDPTKFDATFAEVLACQLAMDCCEEITQSDTKYERARKALGMAMREARRLDAIENPPEDRADGSWVASRL